MRHPEEPGSRVLRDALVRPGLESAQHGFLHALLSQVQSGGSQDARKVSHDPAHLMPEQVLQQMPVSSPAPSPGEAFAPRSVLKSVTVTSYEYNWRSSIVPCSRCG